MSLDARCDAVVHGGTTSITTAPTSANLAPGPPLPGPVQVEAAGPVPKSPKESSTS
jgi:hypothetical protein